MFIIFCHYAAATVESGREGKHALRIIHEHEYTAKISTTMTIQEFVVLCSPPFRRFFIFFEGHKVERSHYERLKLAKLKFNCACKYSANLISYRRNLLFIWKWWILLSSSSFNLYLQQIVNKLKHDENHMREITE